MERMIGDKTFPYTIVTYNVVGKQHEIKGGKKKIEGTENMFMKDEDYKDNLWVKLINLSRFDNCIIDEAQQITNHTSGRSIGVREINTTHVQELSATPVLNRPGELWPIVNVLDKERFPSHGHFLTQYTSDGKTPKI
jgi:SNF2 family DNA or RNA helicase